MRTLMLIKLSIAFCFCSLLASAQNEPEKLDLPGDNLNLYAVMKLFQESPTLEEFEKKLNDETTKINNLDLDGDDNIDYIKVIDNVDGDIHNISLKVAVSKTEDQDVAVFVVQKDRDGKVQIQLIGDEDLYGKDYIIEPNMEADGGTPNPGYTGNELDIDGNPVIIERTTTYQIASWPVIHFIFVPSYTVWHSPWYWGNYPPYWRPWKPFYWHYYYGYHYQWNNYYYGHYRYAHVYRYPNWRDRYYGSGFRSRSAMVQVRYQRGDYRNTYAKPELARDGADVFRRDHPKAPALNNRLPNFDNTGRPIVNRPQVTRPITRPGNDNKIPSRPITRPVITRPGDRNKNTPATPGNRPGFNKPPVTTQPQPSRPAVTRPITKPTVIKPVNRDKNQRRPVVRPVTPKHEKPIDNKPTRDKQKN